MTYTLSILQVGLSVTNPQGREIYIQPGDDTAAMLDIFEALDEVPADKRDIIADMALSEYFG